jgi:hypothetical protein
MSKMITREVVESVTLVRDGKRICLTTGQKFDFTEEEVEQITNASPKALSSKSVVDLDSGEVDLTKTGDDAGTAPAAKKGATKSGGKKSAAGDEL